MPLEAFRRIQVGKEASRGTPTTATRKLLGTLTMTPEINWARPVDERQSLAAAYRTYATSHNTRLRYQGDALYEDIIRFLGMTLKGGQSGTLQTTGVYLWTFTPSLTSANTQDSFTFEYGDDNQAWEVPFVVCPSMQLSIAMGEPVTLAADLIGRFPAKTSFTAGLSEPSVTEVRSDSAKFYIDSTFPGGTTQYSNLLVGGTITLNSGLVPVRYANGWDANDQAPFSTVIEQRRSMTMDLDVVADSNAVAQIYDAYVAGTPKAVAVKCSGVTDALATGYTHELNIYMYGRFVTPPEIFGSRDGEDTFRITFQSFDDGSGNEVKVEVQNNVASM